MNKKKHWHESRGTKPVKSTGEGQEFPGTGEGVPPSAVRNENIRNLERLFSPKGVAVIGASAQEGSVGRALFENFLNSDFKNRVFAVNPFHESVLGKKAFKNVKAIPQKVDLAVIAVPAKFVPSALRDCAQKGVSNAIIISAGFSEIGERELTSELEKIIRENPGTRVLGPNCFGIFDGKSRLNTTFSETKRTRLPKAGSVSFISQSGALGVAILDWMSTQNFGLNKFVSYGNAMDLDESDLLEFLDHDKATKVIAMYIEGAKHGRKFLEIAKKVCVKTPIVALKGGISEQTHKATASHTGSLAGSAEVYRALFRQTGIIQAENMLELFSFAKILAGEPLPKGDRALIITNGGGYGIVTADSVIGNGLRLARLGRKSAERLRKAFPERVTIANPLDLVGDAGLERYSVAIEAALKDKNVDMVIVLVLFNTPAIDEGIVKEIAKWKKKAKKPLTVVSIGSEFTQGMMKLLEKEGVVTFNYPNVCARALKALADFAEFRRESNGK